MTQSETLPKSREGQHLEKYKMIGSLFAYLASIIESGALGNSLYLWCSAVVLKDGLGLEVKVLVLEKRSCHCQQGYIKCMYLCLCCTTKNLCHCVDVALQGRE